MKKLDLTTSTAIERLEELKSILRGELGDTLVSPEFRDKTIEELKEFKKQLKQLL